MSFGHRLQYAMLSLLCAGTVGALGTMLYMKKQGSPMRVHIELEQNGESDIFSAVDKKVRQWNAEYQAERKRRMKEKVQSEERS